MPSFFPDDYGHPYHLRNADEAGDKYTVLYAIEDEKRRREHEAEFDFPYVSDGREIERAIAERAKRG